MRCQKHVRHLLRYLGNAARRGRARLARIPRARCRLLSYGPCKMSRASRSASRAAAFAIAESLNVNVTLPDELLALVLRTLSLRSLRASANVCQRWHELTRPLLADCVKLMLARALTNATQRERERHSQLPKFVLSPRPQVEEAHLDAAAAALVKVRSARPDQHDLKRPLHLDMPLLADGNDESVECKSAETYMIGGSLRVGDSGPTGREREFRRSGAAMSTAYGTLQLGPPDAPRT